jgi:hypothetical protein
MINKRESGRKSSERAAAKVVHSPTASNTKRSILSSVEHSAAKEGLVETEFWNSPVRMPRPLANTAVSLTAMNEQV